jgi:regulator of protease activity HflC (stomatin/prohibitin superfamily)
MFNYWNKEEGAPRIAKIITHIAIALIVVGVVVSYWPLVSVGAGQRGVVTLFGKVQDSVLDEGLHLINPLANVNKISVQTQVIKFDNGQSKGDSSETSSLFAATKDLQDVQIATVVTYHLPPTLVKEVYQQYQGLDAFQNNKLSPVVREAVKSLSAQYTAEELVTKRQEFSDKVQTAIAQRFTDLGATFESFKVVNFEFSAEFTKAIELKATAVQNAEAAKNKLVQVQYEAQQTVAKAQADAEAIKIQAQAINSQGGADYVQLQAIKAWDGHLPTQMIPNGALPFLNLTK